MEYTAKFKRKKRIYLAYIGMEWSDRPSIVNGKYFESVDNWLSERIDVIRNERNITVFDTETIYLELEEFFLIVKKELCGISAKF